jgi:hypothetical protein
MKVAQYEVLGRPSKEPTRPGRDDRWLFTLVKPAYERTRNQNASIVPDGTDVSFYIFPSTSYWATFIASLRDGSRRSPLRAMSDWLCALPSRAETRYRPYGDAHAQPADREDPTSQKRTVVERDASKAMSDRLRSLPSGVCVNAHSHVVGSLRNIGCWAAAFDTFHLEKR